MSGTDRGIEESDVLDLFNYAPYLVRSIANRLNQSGSNLLAQEFGIGLNEWSCIALLAIEQDVSASRICEVGGFDKAVVSRSINALEEKGYVRTSPSATHGRRRLIRLTQAGQRLYRDLMGVAKKREAYLLDGLSSSDRAEFLRLLKLVHANLSNLQG